MTEVSGEGRITGMSKPPMLSKIKLLFQLYNIAENLGVVFYYHHVSALNLGFILLFLQQVRKKFGQTDLVCF